MRLGIVGCGNIARPYARGIAATDGLELVAATDALPDRAAALAAEFAATAHATLDDLLADDTVDAVVNLTAASAHAEITMHALDARKHVHSEKPIALSYDGARALVDLAASRDRRLSAAPATLLGEAQQTAWKLVRDGAIGRVRVAYAEANWGRIEQWHPAPMTLHSVGALGDVGVYPLAILTAMFGPARRVHAYGTTLMRERVDRNGTPFALDRPDWELAIVELDTGVVVRLTASFYVGAGHQRGIEFHGDDGILHLRSWAEFDGRVLLSKTGNADDYEQVPFLREPFHGIDWGRALAELAAAVEEGREPRASADHAAHVVEILDAAETSRREHAPVDVTSSFSPPEPLEWAR